LSGDGESEFWRAAILAGRSPVGRGELDQLARIMAQIVYYFYAALALGAPQRAVSFSVPTGNFGRYLRRLPRQTNGLPIDQLIIATNETIFCTVCWRYLYSKNPLKHTLSPSMDIVISSNFERLLFDCYNRDGKAIDTLDE